MSEAARGRRDSRLPALAGAVVLHAAVLALVIFAPHGPPPSPGSAVPINVVSNAPATDTRPAEQAPQTQTAQAPQPTPEAPPQPPQSVPEPAPPHFSRSTPQPEKAQKPPPTPSPTPARQPQPAAKPFNFNRLQQIIARAKASGHRTSSAARGPARAETAPQARPNAGQGLSESDLAGLTQLLERLWNPNCDVAGGSSVRVQVKFLVGLTGGLLGTPSAGGLEHSPNAVVAAAARRALDAVRQAAPYSEPYYGQSIVVNFDAKEACANR